MLIEDFNPPLSTHHRDECDGRLRQHLQLRCPPLPNRRADTCFSGRQTRLSLAIGHAVLADYPEGVWFADLAPLADHRLVAETVLTAIGLKDDSSRPALSTLEDALERMQRVSVKWRGVTA